MLVVLFLHKRSLLRVAIVTPLRPNKKKSSPRAPLPMRDGVAPSRVWLPQGSWQRLGEFLLQRFDRLDPSGLVDRVQRGDVVNSAGVPLSMESPYQPEQWLWYYREVKNEVAVPFALTVLHADDFIIAVDKPHFLASVPTGNYLRETALTRVRATFDNADITPLHRLDRDTAGVLLFCVQPAFRGAYQRLFQTQSIFKQYEAVAPSYTAQALPLIRRSCIEGVEGEFVVRETNNEANSETVIDALSTWYDTEKAQYLTHYQLQPSTGRKHQLRVHMSALGCPIVNDNYYPVWHKDRPAHDFSQPLQLLARRISFKDPVDGRLRDYCSKRQLACVPPQGAK